MVSPQKYHWIKTNTAPTELGLSQDKLARQLQLHSIEYNSLTVLRIKRK